MTRSMTRSSFWIAFFFMIACAGVGYVDAAAIETTRHRYTFSWPLDKDAPKPRGGATRGAPVLLDTAVSPAWQSLQEKGISSFERDRRAILAMAGTYRVTFDFLEVATYGSDQPVAPYQSWGTEKIYVDRDSGNFISLVHILEMRVLDEQGKVSEPMVTKHWRQDWQYEPTTIVEYRGPNRWERRKLDPQHTKGMWSQTVYQVDESPRYASIGRWQHNSSFSTWLSGETWRPLPRREWSVRDDYQALIGTNRLTIHPTSWTQEEDNLKAVLTPVRQLDDTQPFRGREYGFARYERIKDFDFAAADEYYAKTKAFWDQVRSRWNEVFDKRGYASLRGPVDKLGLFYPLFAQADAIMEDPALARNNEHVIQEALKAMGAL
jgi:hypothetical protein